MTKQKEKKEGRKEEGRKTKHDWIGTTEIHDNDAKADQMKRVTDAAEAEISRRQRTKGG